MDKNNKASTKNESGRPVLFRLGALPLTDQASVGARDVLLGKVIPLLAHHLLVGVLEHGVLHAPVLVCDGLAEFLFLADGVCFVLLLRLLVLVFFPSVPELA